MEEFDGDHAVERPHRDGHPRPQACSGECARASRPGQGGSLAGPAGAEEPIRNMADARRRTIKAVAHRPSISREEVKAFLDGLRVKQDWAQRGYNSFVPLEPMNRCRWTWPKAFRAPARSGRCATQHGLLREVGVARLASTTAAGMKKVFQALGVPANVYSDDGSKFKREFKELMDFWALSLEGVSQMVHILPERLLALVRPAFDLVLRRIRSLKRCVEA